MTNQERYDSLSDDKKAIANNLLANENGGMGVYDVNSMSDSSFERIMRQTDEIAEGKEVSYPSATTEAIKAERERDVEAFNEANKAFNLNEVPIGAIIVKDNKIIAKAHNMKEYDNCCLSHAELIAIKSASKYLNNWRL